MENNGIDSNIFVIQQQEAFDPIAMTHLNTGTQFQILSTEECLAGKECSNVIFLRGHIFYGIMDMFDDENTLLVKKLCPRTGNCEIINKITGIEFHGEVTLSISEYRGRIILKDE
jgi:hypothetical protein